jgi:hypothetical protein
MLEAVEGLATIVAPLLLAVLVVRVVAALVLLEHRHLMELLVLLEQPIQVAVAALVLT